MTEQEKQALKEIQGTRGWQILEYLVRLKLADLDSVSNLNELSTEKVGVQALAQKKAVKLLKDFLSDLGFTQSDKKKDNTYE